MIAVMPAALPIPATPARLGEPGPELALHRALAAAASVLVDPDLRDGDVVLVMPDVSCPNDGRT